MAKSKTESPVSRHANERMRRAFQRRHRTATHKNQMSLAGESGTGSWGIKNPVVVRAVVVMVTAELEFVEPSKVTEEGETVQVAAVGAPVQVHVTLLLNPPLGESVTVKFAV